MERWTISADRNTLTIVTKGALILRDLDILSEMARMGLAKAALSVTTLDRKLARTMEPRAGTPTRRLQAIEGLAEAGIPAGVMFAPAIPALNDHEMETVLNAAASAGARSAGYVMLRLDGFDLFPNTPHVETVVTFEMWGCEDVGM